MDEFTIAYFNNAAQVSSIRYDKHFNRLTAPVESIDELLAELDGRTDGIVMCEMDASDVTFRSFRVRNYDDRTLGCRSMGPQEFAAYLRGVQGTHTILGVEPDPDCLYRAKQEYHGRRFRVRLDKAGRHTSLSFLTGPPEEGGIGFTADFDPAGNITHLAHYEDGERFPVATCHDAAPIVSVQERYGLAILELSRKMGPGLSRKMGGLLETDEGTLAEKVDLGKPYMLIVPAPDPLPPAEPHYGSRN